MSKPLRIPDSYRTMLDAAVSCRANDLLVRLTMCSTSYGPARASLRTRSTWLQQRKAVA